VLLKNKAQKKRKDRDEDINDKIITMYIKTFANLEE